MSAPLHVAWPLTLWNVISMTKDLNFLFYLLSINSNLNSHMRPEATVLDPLAPKTPREVRSAAWRPPWLLVVQSSRGRLPCPVCSCTVGDEGTDGREPICCTRQSLASVAFQQTPLILRSFWSVENKNRLAIVTKK